MPPHFVTFLLTSSATRFSHSPAESPDTQLKPFSPTKSRERKYSTGLGLRNSDRKTRRYVSTHHRESPPLLSCTFLAELPVHHREQD
ncbi:unnamed protein product [Tuber melanosporum]|uniref:(Perigord truffle) hypothetical protein n=1 Tax=Tuber melanosporum (strain Mel28) TaxID=656061 RepID=D5G616_TUBMM|nr:uncharacterized protein GSTUM_00001540001 [Tuber melanosporum]CAZ79959.1 unnamed protein product [Tuber melanosporum]